MQTVDCDECGGKGFDISPYPFSSLERYEQCSACDGSGKVAVICGSCGESLRDCDSGDWCNECREDFELTPTFDVTVRVAMPGVPLDSSYAIQADSESEAEKWAIQRARYESGCACKIISVKRRNQ